MTCESEIQPLAHIDAVGWRDLSTVVTVVKHLQTDRKQEASSSKVERFCPSNNPTANFAPRDCWLTHGAESTRRPHHACWLDDGVDATVELHLSVHAAHRAFLSSDDCHLHLAVIDERVEDGLDVVHGKVHLPVGHTKGT